MLRCTCSQALIGVLVAVSLSAATAAGQTTWYVDDDAPLGGDGQSWQTAFRYLQDALWEVHEEVDSVEIRVAGGTYRPDQDEGGQYEPGYPGSVFFIFRPEVVLRGGYRGLSGGGDPDERDIALFPSVLSGDIEGNDEPGFVNYEDNCYSLLGCAGVDETTVIDGFTLTGANSDEDFPETCGAMGLCDSASPTIVSCTFTRNRSGWGAGINIASDSSDRRPTLIECRFVDNLAVGDGGAMHLGHANPTLIRCVFSGNSAKRGGAIYSRSSGQPTAIQCVFVGNEATEYGGGVCQRYRSGPLLCAQCLFSGNRAGIDGGAVHGGSVGADRLANCTFAGNVAAGSVGGVHSYAVDVVNCVFRDNSDSGGSNELAQLYVGSHYLPSHVNYTCLQGWTGDLGGVGNFGDDPLFVDADGPDNDPNTWQDNDYRLSPGSPCIDAGWNAALSGDPFDLDADGILAEFAPLDLEGGPRFVDDPNTPDTGLGCAPIVDMGAYEFGEAGGDPCFGDLDCDRAVDLGDLAALLGQYGSSAGVFDSDLDADGDVDLSDLEALLLAYGTACE